MKVKLYTNYYGDLGMNPENLLTSEEHAYGSKYKCGEIYNSKTSVIRYFLSQNYYKLAPLGFLIGFIRENNHKNIISLGAGVCVLEYLLKCALPEESVVCAADYDSFLIEAAKRFFPEIIPVEFDFAKDDMVSLKNKLNINFDLAVFFHSAYALDDDDLIRLFGGLSNSGIKHIIDFHGGCIQTKEALEYMFRDCRKLVTGALKRIKPVKALWEKIKPAAASESVKGKFHGYGRTKREIRRLYKKAGVEIVKEYTHNGYTAVLKCINS